MNYFQIAILFSQGALVASLILFLFRLRKILGIGLLFACLGLFQFMQVFLSSTVYVAITKDILVSPGSSVLFTASLFTILLIYIKEDASETRKIIYALVIINIAMSILLKSFSWNIEDSSTYNPFHVSTKLFNNNSWVLLVGTITLFLDSLLIIILYEFVSKHILSLFLRISITMLIVVCFDSVFFTLMAFWNSTHLNSILTSGLISKGVFAIYYSLFLFIYLKYIETKEYDTGYFTLKDIFLKLSYKQKYEIASLDVKKASEEIESKEIKYKTLTNISPVGIFHTRSDGYTSYVNPKWCEISGMNFENALGDGWLQSVHPEDRELIKTEWNFSIANNKKSETEYRFLLKDGSIKWVLSQALPELNAQNKIIGYVGTTTDITDIKLYQQEQFELREKAETANKAKSNFLANMSHEIRTPLNGIIGFTHLLMKTELNENQLTYMSTINESASSLLDIVNDVLDFSKIESGKLELNIENIDLYKLINQIIDLFKHQAKNKNIELILNIDKNVPQFIKTDSTKIKQILLNLLSNALKFTEFGKIRLDITEQVSMIKNTSTINFSVKDTGIGIKPNNIKKIFSSFEQEDNSTSRKFGGTGLGLAISNQLLALMDSKIELISIYREGSDFNFSINVEKYSNINNRTKIDAIENVNENVPKDVTISKKILIVEDNKINMLLVKTLIKKIAPNNVILTAIDGNESIEQFINEKPDLILMDIQMPNKNGYEATVEIRKFEGLKRTPIIAVTAGIFTGEKEKCFEAGMDDYLSKPIVITELEKILKKWLN